MSLQVSGNAKIATFGVKVPFSGSGGTGPYLYYVLPDGAGGVINKTTGLYVAPLKAGVDVIRVTDSVGASADTKITIANVLKLFCDVIATEMQLGQDQVYLYNQKFTVPPDDRLYVAVGVESPKPFGRSDNLDSEGNLVQSVNMATTLSVNIFSKTTEALDRKEEVVMAFNGFYAQQQQELNSFYIAKLSSAFVNLSEIDGPAIPYRFNISVVIQYAVTKRVAAQYYDTFRDVVVTTEP